MESQTRWYLEVEKVDRGCGQGGIAVVDVPSRFAIKRCLDIVHEIEHVAFEGFILCSLFRLGVSSVLSAVVARSALFEEATAGDAGVPECLNV